ncbi:MAG: hypothetical protein WC783_04990 [Candidatus Paceibacterota bacterium]|jgi:hypothetical protein
MIEGLGKRKITQIEKSKEKTPAQQEILTVALKLVQERMESLGVVFHPPDPKKFIFLDTFNIWREGEWTHDNYVLIRAESEGNLGTIVHEAFHFFSSEFYQHGDEAVEQARLNSRREVRSGFHGVFYKDSGKDIEEGVRVNFRDLNEAITEKMAREVVEQNPDLQTRLRSLFTGRKEECLAKLAIALKAKQSKDEKDFESYFALLQKGHEERLKEMVDELRLSGMNEEDIKDFIDKDSESMKKFLNGVKTQFGLDPDFYQDLAQMMTESIEKAYAFEARHNSYNDEVEILNVLLEGLAKVRAREENIPIEDARALCWKEMQTAYLTGTVMHLRKIDRVWGRGTLWYLNDQNSENKRAVMEELRDFLAHI